jgi:hypothetical protein
MGYTTDFYGAVSVEPPLNEDERTYLRKFAETRRLDRERGPYFVDGSGFAGQGHDSDIRDYNNPPEGQPGLWCQWVPIDDGTAIEWDGQEKFYEAEEWMAYLIDHFLKPGAEASKSDDPQFAGFTFDHVVNGTIEAQGEDPDDKWRLVVEDNVVRTQQAKIVWED